MTLSIEFSEKSVFGLSLSRSAVTEEQASTVSHLLRVNDGRIGALDI
jgi:hypothetical protein